MKALAFGFTILTVLVVGAQAQSRAFDPELLRSGALIRYRALDREDFLAARPPVAAAAIHGRLFEHKGHDLTSRFLVLLVALFILFYPRGILSVVALIPAVVMIVFVIRRTEKTSVSS